MFKQGGISIEKAADTLTTTEGIEDVVAEDIAMRQHRLKTQRAWTGADLLAVSLVLRLSPHSVGFSLP
jgi:hypothetical protein